MFTVTHVKYQFQRLNLLSLLPLAALGLAFVPLGYQGLRIHAIRFSFNMYTGPGYLSALLGVVNIVLLIAVFREFKLTKSSDEMATKTRNYGSVTGGRKMKKFLGSK